MSAEADFDVIVTICSLYAEAYDEFQVDRENEVVNMGGYEITPIRGEGGLAMCLVTGRDGPTHLVWDLDSFLQSDFKRWVRS